MIDKPEHEVARLVRDRALIDAAVARAQADAVRRHRLLGLPIAVWRDGRVVIERPLARVSEEAQGSDTEK